ncbi:MAG: hypothetical protein Q9214_004850, partial [Letrouitia sp. 1 TL-2023]
VFQVIAHKALATHAVIRRLEEEAKDKHSMINRCDAAKREELMEIIGELRTELEGLDRILVRYQQGNRIQKAFRMAKIDPSQFCADLGFYLTAINTFTESLSRDTLVRIETVLLKAVQEIQEGRLPDPRYNASARKGLELELAKNGISARDRARYGPAITTFLLGCLSGKIASYHSLRHIALAVKSRDQKAIRDKRPSSEEGVSSGEGTSSEEGMSSGEEPVNDKETSSDEKPFSDEETSSDEKSFSDEETSGSDNSFNDKELFSDREGPADEDAPKAKNKKLSKLIVHTAVKYAKKTLLENIFDII